MSITRPYIQQTDPPRSPKETLPTMYDLPSEDPEEPGLPDEFHLWQADLLSFTFQPVNYPTDQVFVASDLNLYYDSRHPNWYKRPDWFGVVGVPRLYEGRDLRLSYVIWQEGVRPAIVVELLSPGTRSEDLGQTRQPQGRPSEASNGGTTAESTDTPPSKWRVYEQILAIPYYVAFDRYTDELQAFQLEGGYYQPLDLTEAKVWIPTLQIGLGLWQGEYRGVFRQWLRWYDASDCWILTEEEREREEKQTAQQQAQEAQQQAQEAQQQAQEAQQRAEVLAEYLRKLGVNPDEIES
ncbi:MAG: Uma2 family endonuclease [Leptolyngbyaceae cyanobacterium MO_188.B28]|nr:Uma2 family endonuclease [Leptolyngbyaceae cyanobacterium MO_188.B28]